MAEHNTTVPAGPAPVSQAPANEAVSLRLVDREFLVTCEPEEREGLLEAAAYLDQKMRELRANARTPGFDRLAILAAISVAHEFLALRKTHSSEHGVATELAMLRRKIEAVLYAYPRQ